MVTDTVVRTVSLAVGTPCLVQPPSDGVHPGPAMVNRFWKGIDQGKKTKLAA